MELVLTYTLCILHKIEPFKLLYLSSASKHPTMNRVFGRFRYACVFPDEFDDDYNSRIQVIKNTKDERIRVCIHGEESLLSPLPHSPHTTINGPKTFVSPFPVSSEQRRTKWYMNTTMPLDAPIPRNGSEIREFQQSIANNTQNTSRMISLSPMYFLDMFCILCDTVAHALVMV